MRRPWLRGWTRAAAWTQRCAERNGATLLMAAAAGGQEAMVRMLLQRGASVNLQDSLGVTALMAAALNGHTTIVQVLLDAKADASLQTKTATRRSWSPSSHKHTATAQLLRQHAQGQAAEAEAGAAALATHAAATVGEEEAEKEAAEKEAAAKTATLGTATFDAAAKGDAQAVAAWLDKGGGVDAALRRAARRDAADGGRRGRAGGDGADAAAARRERQPAGLPRRHRPDGRCSQWPHHDRAGAARRQGRRLAAGHDGCTALMVAEHHKQTATAQLLRQHAQGQAAEAGRRVRIAGLKGRPELNGRSGVAGRFDAAKGRYEVAVDGRGGGRAAEAGEPAGS